MISEPCIPYRENLPAYALGALDGPELDALQVHLATCSDCQAELAAFTELGSSLLMSVPPRQPPASLRKRLQKRLPSAQKSFRPRFTWSFSRLALSFGVAFLVLMNAATLWQVVSLQNQQARLARQSAASQTAIAMLAYPGTQSIPIAEKNISGSLLLDTDRNVAALVLWNLPVLERNQTYQIWLIDAQENRTSAGLFQTDTGLPFTTTSILSAVNLSNYAGIGVTVEPGGGSLQPTGQRIFKVNY